jgi:uncharacterized protein YpuA (DUF1002 family)
MNNKRVNMIISIILFSIIMIPTFIFADSIDSENKNSTLCFGADLTDAQRSEVLKFFGFKNIDDIKIIEVTNQEERQYLGEYIDSSKIGSRAISSAYVEKLKLGAGITVDLHNITWVTEEMYKNAAITAGIEDAKIIVASPFDVSGTSALTGIIKSFEDITGKKIQEEIKDLANQEMAIMGELKDTIGDKKTIEFIVKAKKEILKNDYSGSGDIKEAVEKIIKELNLDLNKQDIQKIIDFLTKLSKTNIDKEGILENIKSIKIESNFLKDIIEIIKAFFIKIFG